MRSFKFYFQLPFNLSKLTTLAFNKLKMARLSLILCTVTMQLLKS